VRGGGGRSFWMVSAEGFWCWALVLAIGGLEDVWLLSGVWRETEEEVVQSVVGDEGVLVAWTGGCHG
jgi:hypothetical protein